VALRRGFRKPHNVQRCIIHAALHVFAEMVTVSPMSELAP
jgi:hypothetical protein